MRLVTTKGAARRRPLHVRLVGGASLLTALLVGLNTAAADGACLRLRTFTPEERVQLETQYGPSWWRALGLIPGPETADDYVERPFGDSTIVVYMPQRFWDPRGCDAGANPVRRPGPKPR